MANIVLSRQQFNVVGTRPIRHDGTDKVTGRALYGGDFRLPGMLYGKILRSPHAHARIRAIDTSAAEALPGVRAVVTAKDMPGADDRITDLGEGAVNLKYLSDNILASAKVLYKGHAVAAVAATDPHTAEEALKLIKVEYEVLPPVTRVRDAMQEGAPILLEGLRTTSMGQKGTAPTNIATHLHFEKGDTAKGFEQAEVIVEQEFETATVHQGYIEFHNATALWNTDGQLTVWCSTQGAFTVRDQLSQVLQHPVAKIKVVPLEIGGGFGGKIPLYVDPPAALLSRKTGKPVKIVMNRAEVFEATGPTPGSWMRVKVGATRDGKIVAAEASIAFEAGAYPGSAVGAACMCAFAPYDIEHGTVDGYDVVVNKPKSAAYRAPGATQAAFAVETVLDEIAEQLGLAPLEFRLRNAAKEGTRRIDGPVFNVIGNIECMEAARDSEHWKTPLEGPNRGRGVAQGYWFNVGLQSSCVISVNADGTVNLVEGSTDIGGTRASIAMQAAEVLGLRAEDVKPTVVDTDSIGYTNVTGGSRTTFATGWAAYEAAHDVLRQMKDRVARIWEANPDDITYEQGVFGVAGSPDRQMSFKELAAKLNHTGGPITGRASVDPQGHGGAFATHIVDVEVDPETGKVQILRYTAVQDAGKAIHPSYVEGQMQGGAVQGIGWALNEEYFMTERGAMANSTFLDYRMPTTLDLPMIDTIIVEVANPGHPFGARGVGEVPIVPPPAAIANAISRATGVRLRTLPMTPGAILKAKGVI
ncbi:MAG: xanthine dehydrogenase family protein molybdopterin-binding subunit [Chloroflexi bacterium]|nr:xanthine dehydrogenase family protein molybdopterin-binding subunit [Chloroflexota bacterium]